MFDKLLFLVEAKRWKGFAFVCMMRLNRRVQRIRFIYSDKILRALHGIA